MVDEAPRRLTKRPTVARISETDSWLLASSPIRAREPRTEITRPRDVTVILPSHELGQRFSMSAVFGKSVKPAKRVARQIRGILAALPEPHGTARPYCREPPVNRGFC